MKYIVTLILVGLVSLAAAQVTDTLTLTATKPDTTVTLRFIDELGADVEVLDFGTLDVGVAADADEDVILEVVYNNLGILNSALVVNFTVANLPTGYTLNYVRTPYSGGTAQTADAAAPFATPIANTVPLANYGSDTAYMVGGLATSSPAFSIDDASRLLFQLTATNAATEDVNATLTATLLAQ